jgi:ABC-2 type transport system permease protein
MNGFVLFFKKEFIELIKTVKGVVLAVIFLVVGISSPILAKLTPEILKWAGIDATLEEMGALGITEANSIASYEQFFSNFNTMGLFAVIIVFAGIVANEKSKGTAAYILTKNVSRTQFILSKFISSVVFVFVSFVIAIAVQIIYTNILFDDKLIKLEAVLIFSAFLFLYLVFILAFALFSSVLAKSVTPAMFIAFLIFICVNIFAAIPKIGEYSPSLTNNFGLLVQSVKISGLMPNIIITIVCSAIFLFASVELFKRQEL